MATPNHTPRVSCRYGAPMGRGFRTDAVYRAHGSPIMGSGAVTPPHASARVSLRRVNLDSGGYDAGGAYWGHGQPLYSAMSNCGAVDLFVRAASRDAAKAAVRETYPDARFFR